MVGFGASCVLEDDSGTDSDDEGMRIDDCRATLEVLGRNDVSPDGTIQRWEYYTRKEGHFLLREGIIFVGGQLSDLYVESGSEEEPVEHTSEIDESETATSGGGEDFIDSEGDSSDLSGAESA